MLLIDALQMTRNQSVLGAFMFGQAHAVNSSEGGAKPSGAVGTSIIGLIATSEAGVTPQRSPNIVAQFDVFWTHCK